MNLEQIRAWQITKMELNLRTFASILAQTDAAAITTYRDGGTGWTALEVLAHLRDYETVYFQRAQMTIAEDQPLLPAPDPDELAIAGSYNALDWQTTLKEWETTRAAHINFLQARVESDWERPAQHPRRGIMTLHDQLFLTNLHDAMHLEQITRILAEKISGG